MNIFEKIEDKIQDKEKKKRKELLGDFIDTCINFFGEKPDKIDLEKGMVYYGEIEFFLCPPRNFGFWPGLYLIHIEGRCPKCGEMVLSKGCYNIEGLMKIKRKFEVNNKHRDFHRWQEHYKSLKCQYCDSIRENEEQEYCVKCGAPLPKYNHKPFDLFGF